MYICGIYVVFGERSVLFGEVDMGLGGRCVDKSGLFVWISALFIRLCVGYMGLYGLYVWVNGR